MNNLINSLEIGEINSQLRKAGLQKNKLIKKLYKNYDAYLKLIRNQLFSSVEEGIYGLFDDSALNNSELNSTELRIFFDKTINDILKSQIPLLTIEQLEISAKKSDKLFDISMGCSKNFEGVNDYQIEGIEVENSKSIDQIQFQINDNNSTNYQYHEPITENTFSLNLDNKDNLNYYQTPRIPENIDDGKQLILSLFELIDEDNSYKLLKKEDSINNKRNLSQNDSLNRFNLLDDALINFFLTLSYKINLELFKSKLIGRLISEDKFKFLVTRKFMIKHPYPFIIKFDLNMIQTSKNVVSIPNIFFLNITPLELEFKNINLSILRNKLNEFKKEFQILIKKERYWKQKQIKFNSMYRKK